MDFADKYWGCHQMPERSFSFKGYQFPICARCTGVLLGYILSAFMFKHISFIFCVLLCGIMFLDWYVQYLKILESTNIRRLITGICGGIGIMCFIIKIIILFVHMLIKPFILL